MALQKADMVYIIGSHWPFSLHVPSELKSYHAHYQRTTTSKRGARSPLHLVGALATASSIEIRTFAYGHIPFGILRDDGICRRFDMTWHRLHTMHGDAGSHSTIPFCCISFVIASTTASTDLHTYIPYIS
jgi:hypothetical protein